MKKTKLSAFVAATLLLLQVALSAESSGVMIPIGTITLDTESQNSSIEPDDDLIAEVEQNFEFKGEGMCIAVIDTGFYIGHECFVLSTEGRLTKEFVDSLELNAGSEDDDGEISYYVNSKIPFAYNYAARSADVSGSASHGTATASVAAGNNLLNSEHPSGAAPEAQLLLMKVFSDETAKALESDIVAAIEDAVMLGADVICIPFGESCGFSDMGNSIDITKALESAEESGVIVVSAVGDSTRLGEVSPYNKEAAIIAALCDHPDIGTISYPAASSSVIATGSAQSNFYSADCFTIINENGEKERIPFGDSNSLWTLPSGGVGFNNFFDGRELEYEFVPRYGRTEDMEGLELNGKIAVIERGIITFSEKCQNAALHGAIGVIIYDNQPDPYTVLSVRMDISESPIPAVIISGANADKMKESKDKKIYISESEKYITLRSEAPSPSSFSAWGTTPELSLKPDISVIGENIECASLDGGYLTTGGTAISAAKLSGMFACVKERMLCEGLDSKSASAEAVNMLASSAQIMTRTDGSIYSPRTQGSGAAMLSKALDSNIYISSDGSHKIELGELSTYWFSVDVTLKNLSDQDIECEIDAIVGSDGYQTFTYSDLDSDKADGKLSEKFKKNVNDEVSFTDRFKPFENAHIFPGYEYININAYSSDSTPFVFNVKANNSATFHITVLLDPKTVAEYDDVFENGYFVEGYIRAKADGEEASIPFLGFKGDWSRADAVDSEIYSGIESYADPIYLYRNYSSDVLSGKLVLGADPFGGDTYAKDMICLSPTADSRRSAVYLNFGLLRSASDVKISIYNGDKLLSEREYGRLTRTYVDYISGLVVSPQLFVWDGRADDNRYYIFPDGEYRIEVSYKTVGGDKERVLTYPIYLDSTVPVIENIEFISDGDGAFKLRADVSDDFKVSACFVYDANKNEAELIDGYYDISKLGKYIYIEVFDYAMNSTVERFENPYFIEQT